MNTALGSRHAHPGQLRHRLARYDDIPEMAELFLASAGDMHARHAIALTLPPRETVIRAYAHVVRSGAFYIAERDGHIVAMAGAVVRERQWYLSAFWTRPDCRGQGLGMPLLHQVFQFGLVSGASDFFTWSSVDPAAMAACMKYKLVPSMPILLFEGVPFATTEWHSGVAVQPLKPDVADLFDKQVRGARRQADHGLWAQTPEMAGHQIMLADRVVGYFYVHRGQVGPVAWRQPGYADLVLTHACRAALGGSPTVRLAIPGANRDALRFALERGCRLVGQAHLMANAEFGRMDCYLPSGPSLF